MTLDVDSEKIATIIRDIAQAEILPRFKGLNQSDIRQKAPGDFVTIADEKAEELLTQQLPELLPGSVVVGEEAVSKKPEVLDLLKGDAPVWVIDPVDGTYNFTMGDKSFGVLVALIQNGITKHGWLYYPVDDISIYAGKGEGTYIKSGDDAFQKTTIPQMNRVPLIGRVPETEINQSPPYIMNLIKDGFSIRGTRCGLQCYLSLVKGEIDYFVFIASDDCFQIQAWDHAAGMLIVEEAGGAATSITDKPYDPINPESSLLVTGNRDIWSDVYRVVTRENAA